MVDSRHDRSTDLADRTQDLDATVDLRIGLVGPLGSPVASVAYRYVLADKAQDLVATFTRRQNPITGKNQFAVRREGEHDDVTLAVAHTESVADVLLLLSLG